jgi:hypothetical protein
MPTIKLVVQGLGEVPSFKNKKVIGRSRNGKATLYTKGNVKDQMELFTRALEFQLRSLLQTSGTVTEMGCIPPSKIASSLPLDDSLAWIGTHSVSWRKVKKGEEGFEITIEPL